MGIGVVFGVVETAAYSYENEKVYTTLPEK